jgi:membrane protein
VKSRSARFRHSIAKNARLFVPLLKATTAGWMRDNAMRLSAALALYTILSLAPLLVITAKTVALLTRDTEYARVQVTEQIRDLMGAEVAKAIQPMLEAGGHQGHGLVAAILSTAVLIFSATGVFAELQDSMNTIWGVKPKPNQGIRDFIRNRLLSLAMVFGTGFLLVVSMFLTTVMVRLATYLAGDTKWLALTLDPTISFAVVLVLFAGIFKFLPDVQLAWRHVWAGALLTTFLFTVGKYALAMYFVYATPTSAFGAAGSLVAVLLWVYYSSFILFFGAEFTKVWSVRHLHTPVVPQDNAVKVTEEDRARHGIPSEQRLTEALTGDALHDGLAATQAGRPDTRAP